MSNIDFKELRNQLTDEMLKSILLQFDVEPVYEDADKIIFPTCCHNLHGGSPKLYYYKINKMFHCFTQCQETFDIFTLLIKMYDLRGKKITLWQAIDLCEIDLSNIDDKEKEYLDSTTSCRDDIVAMQKINDLAGLPKIDENSFKVYDKSILYLYSFNYIGLMPWIKEGISVEALHKFNILYDQYHEAILIPNFNYKGDLIGIRERFFREEDIKKGKYRPAYLQGQLYNHPTGRTFYGIYENHQAIEKARTCIIFEGEKSVLLYASIYGCEKNIALATLGQNITRDHIQYLNKMGVSRVILAYDTDYEDYKQLREVQQRYLDKAKILTTFFDVSVIMDFDMILPTKSSPIDGGKEIFEKLLKERIYVR